ncbi:alkaline phosphatase [Testudinibacter sp. TR-2022]|uniref:alkaline phosphatase n=1 Tax=Testudinibacter sp. TR-2022 TaxID=2585029 RepID=UPI00111BBC3D|nr:alkaline phosphatase [Testudinibacter sp. TR-2022]TNH06413.1 alkaline phosphatase [Pasteurellaceae bacterium Phil11]TNH22963.1 alkaline phosphatase [Testudinibacter sp. TR-2022]TNH27673.1 alkaline phosphatase [Testudinibacter sp. TR-2022]
MKRRYLLPFVLAALPLSAVAQTIYPIDRATMMADGKFDFKVEFDEIVSPDQVSILINGNDFKDVLGSSNVEFIEKEDGKDVSALWLRNVSIKQAGDYKVEAKAGEQQSAVNWTVYQTPDVAKAKNVIFFLGDGLSVAHRTGARILSKGVTEGKANSLLAMDTLPITGFIGTSSTDAITADSANTMSAYMTGHKSAINALGVYVSRSDDNLNHPKQETLGEVIKRKTNKSVGIVTDSEIQDATPAAVVAHTRRRADKDKITGMLFEVKPDVILGGGSAYFLPQSVPGSKRKDELNYVEMFKNDGYKLVTSNTELTSIPQDTKQLLGLFHTGNMDTVLDRRFLTDNGVSKKFPDQPDLTTMTQTALDVLSQNPDGFVLVVESSLIDKASHPLDWERAIMSTIMFDQSIDIAKKFAETHPDTLIIVTGDHTHGISLIGTVDDDKPGDEMREKVGVYAAAGYPNYEDKNGDGYPDKLDVSKRLAVFFNNYPDYYETFRPKLDGQFVPALKNEKDEYVANEAYKNIPGAVLRTGILPKSESTGVHAIDDIVIQAQGPGSEAIKGYMENSDIFKVIVDSLAINNAQK